MQGGTCSACSAVGGPSSSPSPIGSELQLDAGRRRSGRPGAEPGHTISAMGLLTFAINVTLDGCVDHREGIADDETRDAATL
jgi:hypothetical protein